MILPGKVRLEHDWVDKHAQGCECGDCNHEGLSIGIAIVRDETSEVISVCYGDSAASAMVKAYTETVLMKMDLLGRC
jgi:hypothetical protein